ncbi:hypothetical protein EW146_g777 [Bondarzewia mesenterica]|uniref:Zn(2)-C6 fungal-type domain-containing protein n=1 Tax=Bondarzewia mesenterica TaxID=1095465 RepID=A0A4S4M833_9AGAM|nr:hypothetical protein EW146_g777 [Bondarzewia mesenterica]
MATSSFIQLKDIAFKIHAVVELRRSWRATYQMIAPLVENARPLFANVPTPSIPDCLLHLKEFYLVAPRRTDPVIGFSDLLETIGIYVPSDSETEDHSLPPTEESPLPDDGSDAPMDLDEVPPSPNPHQSTPSTPISSRLGGRTILEATALPRQSKEEGFETDVAEHMDQATVTDTTTVHQIGPNRCQYCTSMGMSPCVQPAPGAACMPCRKGKRKCTIALRRGRPRTAKTANLLRTAYPLNPQMKSASASSTTSEPYENKNSPAARWSPLQTEDVAIIDDSQVFSNARVVTPDARPASPHLPSTFNIRGLGPSSSSQERIHTLEREVEGLKDNIRYLFHILGIEGVEGSLSSPHSNLETSF